MGTRVSGVLGKTDGTSVVKNDGGPAERSADDPTAGGRRGQPSWISRIRYLERRRRRPPPSERVRARSRRRPRTTAANKNQIQRPSPNDGGGGARPLSFSAASFLTSYYSLWL